MLLTLGALVGCGGGADDSSESEQASAFTEQASSICLDAAIESTVDLQLEFGQVVVDRETELAQVIRYEEVIGEADDELRQLEPPADTAATYDDFLAARDEVNAARGDLIDSLQAGNQRAIEADYSKISELDQASYEIAQELGLEGCDNLLPPDQEEDVKATVEEIASSLDGERICDEYLYPEFVDYVFGGREGREGCVKFQVDPANVSEVSFEAVNGYDGGFATVVYTKVGGSDDGLRINDRLFYDEEVGHWRLWDSQEFE